MKSSGWRKSISFSSSTSNNVCVLFDLGNLSQSINLLGIYHRYTILLVVLHHFSLSGENMYTFNGISNSIVGNNNTNYARYGDE